MVVDVHADPPSALYPPVAVPAADGSYSWEAPLEVAGIDPDSDSAVAPAARVAVAPGTVPAAAAAPSLALRRSARAVRS